MDLPDLKSRLLRALIVIVPLALIAAAIAMVVVG